MAQDSPLLSLAPELRNIVYCFAVISKTRIKITGLPSQRSGSHPDEEAIKPPALLATCHQIRQEASSIYYGENTFFHRTNISRIMTAHLWYAAVGRKTCRMINAVEVEYVPWAAAEGIPPQPSCSARIMSLTGLLEKTSRRFVKSLFKAGISTQALQFLGPIQAQTLGDQIEQMFKSGGEKVIRRLAK